jgi:uncharacterized protein YbjT (DUF2867 family)
MILVTGATGNIGSAVLEKLVEAGQPVRVLARDPAKLEKHGGAFEIVKGDLARPETLDAAFAGVDKLFLLATVPDLPKLAGHAIDAAKKAGVKHVVFVSSSAMPRIQIGRWHAEAEAKLKASGIAWTILQPGAFASNTLWWVGSIKAQGAVFQPWGDGKVAPIDPRDIADVAVKALTSPGHEDKVYVLTGPEAVSAADELAKIGAAIGRPLRFVDVPEDAVREAMLKAGSPEIMVDALLEAMALVKTGYGSEITETVEQILGRKARTFDEWLKDHVKAFTSP